MKQVVIRDGKIITRIPGELYAAMGKQAQTLLEQPLFVSHRHKLALHAFIDKEKPLLQKTLAKIEKEVSAWKKTEAAIHTSEYVCHIPLRTGEARDTEVPYVSWTDVLLSHATFSQLPKNKKQSAYWTTVTKRFNELNATADYVSPFRDIVMRSGSVHPHFGPFVEYTVRRRWSSDGMDSHMTTMYGALDQLCGFFQSTSDLEQRPLRDKFSGKLDEVTYYDWFFQYAPDAIAQAKTQFAKEYDLGTFQPFSKKNMNEQLRTRMNTVFKD